MLALTLPEAPSAAAPTPRTSGSATSNANSPAGSSDHSDFAQALGNSVSRSGSSGRAASHDDRSDTPRSSAATADATSTPAATVMAPGQGPTPPVQDVPAATDDSPDSADAHGSQDSDLSAPGAQTVPASLSLGNGALGTTLSGTATIPPLVPASAQDLVANPAVALADQASAASGHAASDLGRHQILATTLSLATGEQNGAGDVLATDAGAGIGVTAPASGAPTDLRRASSPSKAGHPAGTAATAAATMTLDAGSDPSQLTASAAAAAAAGSGGANGTSSTTGSAESTSGSAIGVGTARSDAGADGQGFGLAPALDAQRTTTQTAPSSGAGASTTGNAMEQAVANQVSRALVQNLPNGDKMLVVRLTPPELGTVRIEVLEHQGTLTAHLHAEDDGVRLAIEHSLPSMRDELRALDAPIRDISLSDPSSGRSFTDGQQQPQQRQRSGSARSPSGSDGFSLTVSAADAPLAGSSALGGYVDARGVDMRA
jgi:flagellar hook-length control protein FliK